MSHGFVFPGDTVGGHEMMAAKILNVLAASGKNLKIISSRLMYEKLSKRINPEFNIEFIEANFLSFRFESALGYWNPVYARNKTEANRVIDKLKSVTLVIGGINANHNVVLAVCRVAKRLNVETRIYIPMFHYPREMEVGFLTGMSNLLSAKRVLNNTNKVLTIDEFWADRVVKFASRPELSVQIVHNFLNIPAASPKQISHDYVKRICVVGRMDKGQKGIDYLLKILHQMTAVSDIPKHTWVFIGDGPYLPELRKLADACNSSNIGFEFHGWSNNSVALMSGCDSLVMTSRWEGIPTVVAEARLLNLQVFAFDIAAIDRLVEPSDLVPSFDTIAYSNKLIEYLHTNSLHIKSASPYLQMLCDEERFTAEASSVY